MVPGAIRKMGMMLHDRNIVKNGDENNVNITVFNLFILLLYQSVQIVFILLLIILLDFQLDQITIEFLVFWEE